MRLNRPGAAFGSVTVDARILSTGGAMVIERPTELRLVTLRQGRALLRAGGGEVSLEQGDAALLGVGVDGELVTTQVGSMLAICGPGELAQDVQAELSDVHPVLVPRHSALLRPVVAFALQAARGETAQPTHLADYYIERLLQEMLQGMLAELSASASTAPQSQGPYRRAMALLAVQYADPGLTSEGVAESVSLSRRQLEREFARRGTTIRGELRRIRLERAKEMLSEPGYAMLGIEQIAQHVGFSGASSLARAMSQANYGPPSSLRP